MLEEIFKTMASLLFPKDTMVIYSNKEFNSDDVLIPKFQKFQKSYTIFYVTMNKKAPLEKKLYTINKFCDKLIDDNTFDKFSQINNEIELKQLKLIASELYRCLIKFESYYLGNKYMDIDILVYKLEILFKEWCIEKKVDEYLCCCNCNSFEEVCEICSAKLLSIVM
jgi:hypothetical protein